MENSQLLFLDFEFSMPEGKGIPKDFFPEIIEVGLVVVQNNVIMEKFSAFVKPIFFPQLSERCKGFLGMTQGNVDEGIPFSILVSTLREYHEKGFQTIIAWGNADEKVLRENCERNQIPYPFSNGIVDLSLEYKRFFGDKNQTGLRKAVESYGQKGIGEHHRALDDSLTTYEIYKLVQQDKSYLGKPKPSTIGERIDWGKLKNLTVS